MPIDAADYLARDIEHARVDAREYLAGPVACLAAASNRSDGQHPLVRKIVIDHPIAPELAGGIQVKLQLAPARRQSISRRGWIEGEPSPVRDVSFDPGVRVAGANNIAAGQVVEFAAAKAGDDAAGNALRAKHDGHGRGKVFAMSTFALE